MDQPPASRLDRLETVPDTILIVEDEVLIRFVIADYLRDCGFQVIEANDGAEAITLLEDASFQIDLVFSDVQMPGPVNGFGVAQWVRRERPGLPIILTSGNVDSAELAQELCAIGPIEAKPYDAAALVQRIRRLLGPGPTSANDGGHETDRIKKHE